MRKHRSEQEVAGVPLADAVPAAAPDRLVDGVPVRTYRGASLAALAPQIRAELGDNAMILRQREGVTGGIGGFFAKRMVEIDVAVIGQQAPAPPASRIDTTDGPSVGPREHLLGGGPEPSSGAPQPTVTSPQSRELMPPVPPIGSVFASPEPAEPQPTEPFTPVDLDDPAAAPTLQPTVPFSAIADRHGLDEARAAAERALHDPEPEDDGPTDYGMFSEGLGAPAVPPGVPLTHLSSPQPPAFTVGAPSAQDAANIEAQLAAGSAERSAHQRAGEPGVGPDQPAAPANRAPASEAQIGDTPAFPAIPEPPVTPTAQAPIEPPRVEAPAPPVAPARPTEPFVPPTSPDAFDSPFDPGRGGAEAAPVAQTHDSFEARVREAGLAGSTSVDPVAQLGDLQGKLLRRGLPDQIASPVVDDTLLHRVPLQPGRPVAELLASELARRVPTAPLAGRAGQAVAFVGSGGAGKTRAIARLAAAYGAAARVPVACVTLQDSGNDG
ncbi:MAG: hypothetical protein REI11_15450, partial [Patulibacter sp.]|nr:hypothetical protein [Patulibacter sp.]